MNKKTAILGFIILIVIGLLITVGLIYKGIRLQKTTISQQGTNPKELKKTILSFLWIEMDLPYLVKESETIVRGKVVKVKPSVEGPLPKIVIGDKAANKAKANWKGEPYIVVGNKKGAQEMTKKLRRDIYTDKIIKVEKCYKNSLPTDEIVVREMGGRIGNRQDIIAGLTPLKIGDEVILFVRKYELKGFEDKYLIIGGPQGKYYIKRDQTRNEYTQKTKKLSDLEAEIMTLLNQ